jgi:hypothetical protein
MTACLLITPSQVPTILSDIVVTRGDIERAKRPVRSRLGAFTTDAYVHARKLSIVSDQTCVTAAGQASQIARFLDDLKGNINAFERQERPARHIAELANSYAGIEVLASFAKQTPGGIAENHTFHVGANMAVGDSLHYKSDVFGMVKVAGNGGEALHKMVSNFEGPARQNLELTKTQLQRLARRNHPNFSDHEREYLVELQCASNISLALCEAITTRTLVNEMNGFERRGHGGFLEYAMFDPFKERWCFRPSAIYCIFSLTIADDGKFVGIEPTGLTLIYQSRPEGGFINVITAENSVFHVCVPPNEQMPAGSMDNPFHAPWKPERVVFCFVEKKSNGHHSFLANRVLNPNEHRYATYIYDETGFKFGVDMEWLEAMVGIPKGS